MRRHEWLLAAFIIVLTARLVEAQAGGSALQGRVTDEQQAVLPGVAILVTHQESGTFRETVSGPDGAYFTPGLPPGRYRVTAELQGFKKFSKEDVLLQLGMHQTLEVRLEVGGLTETVTVVEEASAVDLTSALVGGNVGSRELLDLPSPTRNFISFVAMVPGVQLNPSAEGSDSISVNGQSSNQVTFVLDGGNNTDDNSASPSGAQARTPLEAVEEFQVQTNQFDVEFGRTTGGVVNAITKRGTNAFRGSAFGYLTNSAMTAPTILAKQAGRRGVRHRQAPVGRHDRRTDHSRQASLLHQLRALCRRHRPHQCVPDQTGSELERQGGIERQKLHDSHRPSTECQQHVHRPLPHRASAQSRPAHRRACHAQHGQLRARRRPDGERGLQSRHRHRRR